MAEKWTLKGRVVVDHLLPELKEAFGAREGVPGVTVKVSARSKIPTGWGWWNSWGKVTTGADGRFSVSENHGGDRRQFKVEVLFDSDRLRLKEGQETSIRLDGNGFPLDVEFDLTDKDWFEVHHDERDGARQRPAGRLDRPRRPCGHRRGGPPARRHVVPLRPGDGPARGLRARLRLRRPGGGQVPDGHRRQQSGLVLLQQSVHPQPLHQGGPVDDPHPAPRVHAPVGLRPLDRRGRHGLAARRSTAPPTQTRENTTFVPFREAFADWAAHRVLKEITGGKLLNFKEDVAWKYPDLPLSRSYVGAALAASERKLANVDFTERGWHSLFNILTLPYLDRCDFNRTLTEQDTQFAFYALFTSKSCPEVRLAYTLKEVLSVWLKYPGKGIDSFMGNGDLDFFHFLGRAGAILPGLEQEKIKMVKTCLDPNSAENPCPG